jgi:hypothetical protein
MRLLQTSSWCIYTLMKIRAISLNEVEQLMSHLNHQYNQYLAPIPGTLPSFYPIPLSPEYTTAWSNGEQHKWMRESCLRYYKSMWFSTKSSEDPPMLHDVRWSIEKRMHQMRALQPSTSSPTSSSSSISYDVLPEPLLKRIEFKVSDDTGSVNIPELVNQTLSSLSPNSSPTSSSVSMIPSWRIRWPHDRRDEFVEHSFRYYRRSLLTYIRQLLITSGIKPSGTTIPFVFHFQSNDHVYNNHKILIEWIHGEESHSVSGYSRYWTLHWLTKDGVIGVIKLSEVAPLVYIDHYRPSAMISAHHTTSTTAAGAEHKRIGYDDEGEWSDGLTTSFVDPKGKWKGEVSRDINYLSSQRIIDRMIHSCHQRFGSSYGMITLGQLSPWLVSPGPWLSFLPGYSAHMSHVADFCGYRTSLENLFFMWTD